MSFDIGDPKNVTPSSPEEAITGPKEPPGYSGIRPQVLLVRSLPLALIVAGAFWFFTHPIALPNTASAGTIQGKVSPVSVSDLAVPTATPRPIPTRAVIAVSDLSPAPVLSPTPIAPPQMGQAASYTPQPIITPSTPSPAQVEAQRRREADEAAIEAPLPSPVPIRQASHQVSADDFYQKPPSEIFLAPGTEIDVTLYTSEDSTVQSQDTGTIIGYTGRPVLDYYKRVVVIPPRSKIVGHMVSTTLQPGQARIGAIWEAIQLPNGESIALDKAPGIDLTGTVGFGATIDNHTRKEIVNVIAFSLLAAGAQLAQPQNSNVCSGGYNCSPSVGQSIAQSFGTQLQNYASNAYSRSQQIEPTAHVVEGAQVGVMITNYLPMKPYNEDAQ